MNDDGFSWKVVLLLILLGGVLPVIIGSAML